VRLAAKQRAVEAIQLDRPLCLSRRDDETFQAALAEPFRANEALLQALNQVHTRVKRDWKAPAGAAGELTAH